MTGAWATWHSALRPNLQIVARLAITALLLNGSVDASAPPTLEWVRQFGHSPVQSDARVQGTGVTLDQEQNVYVTGLLGHTTVQISPDSFVAKFDPTGNLVWTQDIAEPNDRFTNSEDIAVDPDGNVIVTGFTTGNLAAPSAGFGDIFLRKYDPAGHIVWTQQLGDTQYDFSHALDIDRHGNIFITGTSSLGVESEQNGAYLAKFDPAGNLAWIRTPELNWTSYDLALDADSNIYMTGAFVVLNSAAPYGVTEQAFLIKYDLLGNLVWTRELGDFESDEVSSGVGVDQAGNVFIAGFTTGDLAQPNAAGEGEPVSIYQRDVFVAKFDSNGERVWVQQFGRAHEDVMGGLSVDGHGNVYVTGSMDQTIGGANPTRRDVFLTRLDNATGEIQWIEQYGTANSDSGAALFADHFGNVLITGSTSGALAISSGGAIDAFLLKYTAVPEPASIVLLAFAAASFLLAVDRRNRRVASVRLSVSGLRSSTKSSYSTEKAPPNYGEFGRPRANNSR